MPESPYRRQADIEIAQLSVKLEALEKSIDKLASKVDDLTEAKFKGIGMLIAVGGVMTFFGGHLKEWIRDIMP